MKKLVCVLFLAALSVSPAVYSHAIPVFQRGDVNGDGSIDISDFLYLVRYLDGNEDDPPCLDAADVNDDGWIDSTDWLYFVNWMYSGGFSPPAPGPYTCGQDPTTDSLSCEQESPTCQ